MGFRSRTLVALSVASTLFVATAPVPSHAGTTAEGRARRLINRDRVDAGRPALRRDARLDDVAERHARRMRRAGKIFHQTKLGSRIPGAWKAAGENVGMHATVPKLHRAFMASPAHRRNILRWRFDAVGIGIVRDKRGRIFEVQIFVDR